MDEMIFDNTTEETVANVNAEPINMNAESFAPIAAEPVEEVAETEETAAVEIPRAANPRRKKKSQLQIFKENYLPLIIAGAAVLLILVFIIGSLGRAIKKHNVEKEASIAASESIAAQEQAWATEAAQLLSAAEELAAGYDYVGAIAAIDSFSGDITAAQDLMTKRAEYVEAQRLMTEWSNPNDVKNLSFHLLIADPARAFVDEEYGWSYNNNFITTTEFSNMLQELYDNGYMLVSMDDFVEKTVNNNGLTVYDAKSLYLPSGKKPLMITQTNVNYYTYMVDGDEDGLPDKDGAGFASKLVIGPDGKLANEMVDAQGNVVTGAFDLVPILNAFIEAHPDFSFGGAKATLAVTGYDGLFGYRTDAASKEELDEAAYNAELKGAAAVINALRADGYEFACYTYGNVEYGEITTEEIQKDLNSWNEEVAPLLGSTNTLVYALNSDIADPGAYGGDAFQLLRTQGFENFIGFCNDGNSWVHIDVDYVRQGRILVTGSNIINNSTWFTGLFDTETILDSSRPTDAE